MSLQSISLGTHETGVMPRVGEPRWRRFALAAAGLTALVVLLVLLAHQVTQSGLADLRTRAENTKRLAVTALAGELARFERLPRLLADQPAVRDVARRPDDPGAVRTANLYLEEINALLGSSDLYVMLPDGLTVAASNHAGPLPFVGQNFAYRPYFSDALDTGHGQFFALGTTSMKRGYYFGAPIRDGGEVIGVIVQKIDLDRIELSWAASEYMILVTDTEGIIFLSGRPDWTYSSFAPLSPEAMARSVETRRYAGTEIRTLPLSRIGSYEDLPLFTLSEAGGHRELLLLSEEMPSAGWTVQVMIDTAGARAQARTVTLAAGLGLLVMGLVGAGLVQRRAAARVRMADQLAAQALLEQRVEERTAELATVNRQLAGEVAERRAAESELRRTQRKLVQSGKLAAIGQMSAALSHEFNQPLGALRNFAENAATYLARGSTDEAAGNVARILALTDRMSEISRSLRNFARQPRRQLAPVDLSETLREALAVTGWRRQETPVAVDTGAFPDGLFVMAEAVRLQQVLVNLVSNAMDALAGRDNASIAISARRAGDRIVIRVEDNGPGIPSGQEERIFDPFYSTKGAGKGMGLGLSISYNIIRDFGGELHLRQPERAGAVFEIDLPAVDPPRGMEAGA